MNSLCEIGDAVTALERDSVLYMAHATLRWLKRNMGRFLAKAGFNPSQPRVPRGQTGAGQWANVGGAGSAINTPNISTAVNYLRRHARPTSQGQCAAYVRRALNAGGFVIKPVRYAKNYGPGLEKAGFVPVSIWKRQFDPSKLPPNGYNSGYLP